MNVTSRSEYRGARRISREKFSRLLRERANPEVITERDPGEYYDAILGRGCDPLFILAMFGKESTWGKHGVAASSKSWGNTRAPNFGATPVGEMPGRTGTFPTWASWMDGCISTVARLMSPDWYYAGEERTIGEVFIDPHHPNRNPSKPARPPIPRTSRIEWAPAGDLNSPDGYLAWMLRFMNEHQDLDVGTSPSKIYDVPFRISHIPAGNKNRPGGNFEKRFITWHETANTNVGANAEMHRRFTHNGGGSESVSFHYVVDDKEIIQLLPHHEKAWHAGDGFSGEGNTHSIGVELCVHRNGDFQRTLANAAKLGAWLHKEHGIPADANVQHNRWSGKDCPRNLRLRGWTDFREAIRAFKPDEGPSDGIRIDPVTGKILSGGFRRYYEWLESQLGASETQIVLGRPLTNELDEDSRRVQYFERARFEWHPGSRPQRFDVLFGRLGSELLQIRAEAEQLRAEVEQRDQRIRELESQQPIA